jgi:hypothetical protein
MVFGIARAALALCRGRVAGVNVEAYGSLVVSNNSGDGSE